MAIGKYVFAVLLGLLIHFFLLFVFLTLVAGGGLKHFLSVSRALLTAFGTASSSATLPITMDCLKEAGVEDRSIKFVLPLGATINMDGTALYEAVAVMFIAQAYGIEMSAIEQGIILSPPPSRDRSCRDTSSRIGNYGTSAYGGQSPARRNWPVIGSRLVLR